jgi:hypothetical protein
MIEIYRPGEEIGDFGDAASEVAIRTAALGGPYPLLQAPEIESKFGTFNTFDFVASPDGAPRQCLGFVRAFEQPRLAITGWHCRAALEIIDRSVIACALERLALVMAASEPKVTELFARAERQRRSCGQRTSVLARLSNTLQHLRCRSCVATSPRSDLLFQERILPAAWRAPRRECRFQIVEHDIAIVAFELGHAVPLSHEVECILPLPARLPLGGNQLEAMTGRAGIEGLVAARPGRIVGRAFVARRERLGGRRLRGCGRQEDQEDCQHARQARHHAIRIATRCMGFAP